MAYYLSMDGVDDYVQCPTITFDEVIMDMSAAPTGFYKTYLDTRVGGIFYFARDEGYELIGGYQTAYKNGVEVANGTHFVLDNERATFRITSTINYTDDVTIFAAYTHGDNVLGNLYRVTFKLSGVTVADYDMSTGNVNDQSGNGNHATLTGGTWVNDAPSGTNYPVSLSDTLALSETVLKMAGKLRTDSLALSETFSKMKTVIIIDTVSMSDGESDKTSKTFSDSVSVSDSVSSTKGKAVNLSDSLAITDSIRKALTKVQSDSMTLGDSDSEAVLKAFFDLLALSDSVTTFKGKTVILSDNLNVTDSINKVVGKLQTESLSLSDSVNRQANVTARLYDVLVMSDSIQTFLPNAPSVIGIIKLHGERELHIHLISTRELNLTLHAERILHVNLRGDLMTKIPQNFDMVAGETKLLDVDLTDSGAAVNLSGATIKWAMRRLNRTTSDVFKDTNAGITITDAAAGKFTITLSPSDTAALRGDYYHETEVIDANGNVSTVMTGRAAISASNV